MIVKRCLSFVSLTALVLLLPGRSQCQEKKNPRLPEGTKVERNLEYGPHKEQNLLDLYLPKADGPLPVIVFVHGGGWRTGSKDSGGPSLVMLSKGYAVASINYRLIEHGKYPAQIEDCKAAVRFLRANAKKYNLDPDHIGAWGSSAGGHLVALLGTTGDAKELEGDGRNKEMSSRVQAVCDWFGPTDILKMRDGATPGGRADPKIIMETLLGGSLADKKDMIPKTNPITFVSKKSAPFMIVHGTEDTTVPVSQSQILHDALQKVGADSTLVIVKDAAHGKGIDTPDTMKKIEEFFDKHLKVKK